MEITGEDMDLQVVRTFPGELYLQWRDAQVAHYPAEIYVQRSAAFTGPYVEIAGPLQGYAEYKDTLIERNVRYYYRLRILLDGQSTYLPTAGGVTTGPLETLLIAEIRYQLYMDLYWKQDMALYYPAKSSGPRCVCYDSVRRKHDNSCPACYGNGYSGGFYNPIVLPVRKGVVQDAVGGETDRVKASTIRVTFPGVFSLHTGDVFVDSENSRWIMSSVEASRYEGAIVRYFGTATPVPADSPLVSLPADLTLLVKPEHLIRERVT